jgi:hypothetical protein
VVTAGCDEDVIAIVVTLPFCSRPMVLPVLAAPADKGRPAKPDLARGLLDVIAEHFPDYDIDAVGDSAYGAGAFAGLGEGMTMTTRARTNAVLLLAVVSATSGGGSPTTGSCSTAQPASKRPATATATAAARSRRHGQRARALARPEALPESAEQIAVDCAALTRTVGPTGRITVRVSVRWCGYACHRHP